MRNKRTIKMVYKSMSKWKSFQGTRRKHLVARGMTPKGQLSIREADISNVSPPVTEARDAGKTSRAPPLPRDLRQQCHSSNEDRPCAGHLDRGATQSQSLPIFKVRV